MFDNDQVKNGKSFSRAGNESTIVQKTRGKIKKKVEKKPGSCRKCGTPITVFGTGLCWECYKDEKLSKFD